MILKPKDLPARREPNPRVMPDGRVIFKKPSPAWTRQRFEVYQRDGGRCQIKFRGEMCGKVLYFNSGDPFLDAQVDHVKAKRMGRDAFTDDRESNLQLSCIQCHDRKHSGGR